MKTAERFEKVINHFSEAMPVAETELEYTDPYELIVAVILSAQCTDKRVNLITPRFFQNFPDAASLARAGAGRRQRVLQSSPGPRPVLPVVGRQRAVPAYHAVLHACHAGRDP